MHGCRQHACMLFTVAVASQVLVSCPGLCVAHVAMIVFGSSVLFCMGLCSAFVGGRPVLELVHICIFFIWLAWASAC